MHLAFSLSPDAVLTVLVLLTVLVRYFWYLCPQQIIEFFFVCFAAIKIIIKR